MRFVFAPDSFKGSLSSVRLCEILTDAARRRFPDAECVSIPAADGGEGTLDALLAALGGDGKAHGDHQANAQQGVQQQMMLFRHAVPHYTAKACAPMVNRTSRDQIQLEVAVAGL